ncbi:MAG: glycosyltransferase family 4 protein [Acidithiobacillus sp.]
MKMAAGTTLRHCLRSLLYDQRLMAFARKLLRPFPGLEEEGRVLVYRLKKFANERRQTPLMQSSPATREGHTRQLLFDVSELALKDIHTGIQRVVRALLGELLRNSPPGFCVRAVRADADGRLLYADKFTAEFLNQKVVEPADDPVEITVGDIFFSADLYLHFPFPVLQSLRAQGLRVIYTIHDLIPLQYNTSPRALRLAFSDWLENVLAVADAVVCISRSVADEAFDWLLAHPDLRQAPLPIGWFHLGADLQSSKPTAGMSGSDEALLAQLRDFRSFLMVGTIEPRKGHAQALDALETLWAQGEDINLVIVGKEGWRNHDLVHRLRHHPERDRRLFWLERASDDLLLRLYAQSTALLAASFAEGFGLPLIEAAHHGLPIIARDITVFREVAGDHAFYFPNDRNPEHLADAILHWLVLHAEGRAPQSRNMPFLTWAGSNRKLLHVILENDWYTTYHPAKTKQKN